MRKTAIEYAKLGCFVLPIDPATKKPLVKWGHRKHQKPTVEEVIEWWQKWPYANIGIATGEMSGIDVVDIDSDAALGEFTSKTGITFNTILWQMTGKGYQFFFKFTGKLKNNVRVNGVAIDIRSTGGYVIVPPSVHSNGNTYTWYNPGTPLAEMPQRCIDYLTGSTHAPVGVQVCFADEIPEGSRNDTVYREACRLRTMGCDHDGILQALIELNEKKCCPALSIGELTTIARQACKYPQGHNGNGVSRRYERTELGNAERFADQYRDNVRYVAQWKKWIVYNGKRWEPASAGNIRQLVHKVVKSLFIEASEAATEDERTQLSKWAITSQKSSSISATLKEASALLEIGADELDTNGWLLNVNNCTIDLKTGLTRPHERNDFITKIVPVDYLPDAKAPVFTHTLETCLEKSVIDFIQRYFGYSLTGSVKEQCFSIWQGEGRNGKTTILNAVSDIFGDYVKMVRPEALMVRFNKDAPMSELAQLKGARLVTASEGEDGQRLAESLIKQMSGEEKIKARFLYAEPFEFKPEFKIILSTNHKPKIRGTELAVWRRVRLIPWDVTIPENEVDKDLPEKLKAELPGILRWVVEGAMIWRTEGLGYPEKIKKATNDYQSEQNAVKNFIEQECVLDPNVEINATFLHNAFKFWSQEEGYPKISKIKFGKLMKDLGRPSLKDRTGYMVYKGLALNTPGAIKTGN